MSRQNQQHQQKLDNEITQELSVEESKKVMEDVGGSDSEEYKHISEIRKDQNLIIELEECSEIDHDEIDRLLAGLAVVAEASIWIVYRGNVSIALPYFLTYLSIGLSRNTDGDLSMTNSIGQRCGLWFKLWDEGNGTTTVWIMYPSSADVSVGEKVILVVDIDNHKTEIPWVHGAPNIEEKVLLPILIHLCLQSDEASHHCEYRKPSCNSDLVKICLFRKLSYCLPFSFKCCQHKSKALKDCYKSMCGEYWSKEISLEPPSSVDYVSDAKEIMSLQFFGNQVIDLEAHLLADPRAAASIDSDFLKQRLFHINSRLKALGAHVIGEPT